MTAYLNSDRLRELANLSADLDIGDADEPVEHVVRVMDADENEAAA